MSKRVLTKKPSVKEPKTPKSGQSPRDSFNDYLVWVKENWGMLSLIIGFTFLVIFMKVHEEMSTSLHGEKSEENFYETLGVPSQASMKDIKKQYNKLAVEFHPDRHPNCAVCEEKFRRISKAYEVLSNEESKEHYDQTSGVLEPIKSQTTSLYASNYAKTVEETPNIWIIQVYSENSSNSQTFAGFWEDLALEHDYINFGRINYISQSKLLPKLPFAVDELPSVFSLVPGQHSEVLEYSYDRSPNAELRNFLKTSIGVHYKTISPNDFTALQQHRSDKSKIILVGIDNIPIVYMYQAFRYKQYFDFFVTQTGSHKVIYEKLKKEKASVVFSPAKSTFLKSPERVFEIPYDKNSMKSFLSYAMFTTVPGFLIRNQ